MMAAATSLEIKAGCYEYRSLADDVQVTPVSLHSAHVGLICG